MCFKSILLFILLNNSYIKYFGNTLKRYTSIHWLCQLCTFYLYTNNIYMNYSILLQYNYNFEQERQV